MNAPDRRRVFAWRLGGWCFSVVVGYRVREGVSSLALQVAWSRSTVV